MCEVCGKSPSLHELLPSNTLSFQTAILENTRKEQYPAKNTTYTS